MKSLSILFSFLLVSTVALADHKHGHVDTSPRLVPTVDSSVEVQQNELLVQVHGVVCSFCSYGIRKKISRLPYVDHTRFNRGVHVDIQNQKVLIAIKPGTDPDLGEISSSIKSGGYEPIAVYLNLDGKKTVRKSWEVK